MLQSYHYIVRATDLHVCAFPYLSGAVAQRKSPGGEAGVLGVAHILFDSGSWKYYGPQ